MTGEVGVAGKRTTPPLASSAGKASFWGRALFEQAADGLGVARVSGVAN